MQSQMIGLLRRKNTNFVSVIAGKIQHCCSWENRGKFYLPLFCLENMPIRASTCQSSYVLSAASAHYNVPSLTILLFVYADEHPWEGADGHCRCLKYVLRSAVRFYAMLKRDWSKETGQKRLVTQKHHAWAKALCVWVGQEFFEANSRSHPCKIVPYWFPNGEIGLASRIPLSGQLKRKELYQSCS